VRDWRRGGFSPPPDDASVTWRLLWAIIGATTFTVIMFLFDLI
jgi:hypothetical protein